MLSLNDVNEEATNRWGEQLELCRKSSFNPTTENFYAYSRAGSPTRVTTASRCGSRSGSRTARRRGRPARRRHGDQESQGVPVGIGLSQEIDSNMAGSALMWSFGASVQDENENVTINCPRRSPPSSS